jgi:hypothetical protein
VANERFRQALEQLGVIYSKTKGYVLRAEEVDPESRSNLAIFKEQRDALDHVMRALTEYFAKGDEADEDYLCEHINNAVGHMFRAAYDTLDGTGVSYKFRLRDALKGISSKAISAVYPDYYTTVLPTLNKIDETIAEHREHKDEQRSVKIQDLDGYCSTIEALYGHVDEITVRIPEFRKWQIEDDREKRKWFVIVPSVIASVIFLLGAGLTLYVRHLDKLDKQNQAAKAGLPASSSPSSKSH